MLEYVHPLLTPDEARLHNQKRRRRGARVPGPRAAAPVRFDAPVSVVGVFAQGPLAGRLRVQGEYPRWTSWTGTTVYAIPRHALVHGKQDSLVLNVTPTQARGAWLLHVLRRPAPAAPWLRSRSSDGPTPLGTMES